jgi:ureidoacrylate peracid hydrolase
MHVERFISAKNRSCTTDFGKGQRLTPQTSALDFACQCNSERDASMRFTERKTFPTTMPLELNPEKTCLLFFDMLNGHVKKEDPDTKMRYSTVVPNAVALLNKARELSIMVAYAAANHRADDLTTAKVLRDTDNKLRPVVPDAGLHLFHVGSWEVAVIDELKPLEADYHIPKYRWSAFHQTYLDLALRTRKIDTIIISGGSTDVGVASTAFSGRDLDYNLIFAEDACSSHQMDNHRHFMKRVFPRMGRVRTTAQVLSMLGA